MAYSVLEIIPELGVELQIPLKLFNIFVRNIECVVSRPLGWIEELEERRLIRGVFDNARRWSSCMRGCRNKCVSRQTSIDMP
jgi:hypothetical protein